MKFKFNSVKVYLFVLSVIGVILLGYNQKTGIIDIVGHIGVLFFVLGMIFLLFGLFNPKPESMLKVDDFRGYFNFLFTIGLIVIPFIFASKYLGQATLGLTEGTKSPTGNLIAQTVFNTTFLNAALVLGIAVFMLVFLLFLMKD